MKYFGLFLQIHKDLDGINHRRRSKISDEFRFRQPIYHDMGFSMHLTRVFNEKLHNHITPTSCNLVTNLGTIFIYERRLINRLL